MGYQLDAPADENDVLPKFHTYQYIRYCNSLGATEGNILSLPLLPWLIQSTAWWTPAAGCASCWCARGTRSICWLPHAPRPILDLTMWLWSRPTSPPGRRRAVRPERGSGCGGRGAWPA